MARPIICIAGAGTAGLEGLLGLHEQLGSRADLRLIAPEHEFRFRPMSADSLFRPARERATPIGQLVAELGSTHIVDRVAAVHQSDRCVLTRSGDEVGFDYLLLALGGRPQRTLRQGYVWERGQDPGFLDDVLYAVRNQSTPTRVAVIVPRGARWPVPAYELALVLAWASVGTAARISLITAESRPLGALGAMATDAVMRELAAAGVETVTGVEVIDTLHREAPHIQVGGSESAQVMLVPEGPGSDEDALNGEPTSPVHVHRAAGEARTFEFVLALPTMLGPALPGVAADVDGFVEVDERLRVRGSDCVWAAGSCVAAALEHSALSAQQADVAAAGIGHAAGFEGFDDTEGMPEVTGILLTDQRDRWLAENPVGTREPSTRCLWWPPGRAVGHMLAGRIAAWDPLVQQLPSEHPDGVPVCVPVALGPDTRSVRPADFVVDDSVRKAREHDLENRQLMTVARHEREAEAELRLLSGGLDELAAHQRRVIASLRQHGYLLDRHR